MKKPALITFLLIVTSFLVILICNDDANMQSQVEPTQSVVDPKISKTEADKLIKKAALSMITAHFESSLKQSLATTAISANNNFEFPATCFAPDTDQAVIDNFYQYRTEIMNSLGLTLETEGSRFNLGSRWGTTALDGSGLGQGDITTLTWSYVPDGTPIGNGGCGVPGESTDNSNFIAFFNGIYGAPTIPGDFTTAPWHNVFISMFDSWSNASGLIFVYEPNDDGATVVTGGPGVAGTRGDMRISGHRLDGNSNVLACNYFPENGDMIIDTDDNFYANNPTVGTTNVLTHEIGHGLGLFHVCPVNLSKLMEPTVTVAFEGPQEDDILATNRHYGDPEGVNDTSGTASFLGNDANPATYSKLQRSIDDNADVDYFSFTISEATVLAATLTPTGTTYLDGVQNPDGSCTAGTPFNALTVSDLMVEVLGTDGSTVIATANANGAGVAENLVGVGLPLAGTYFVRVRQQGGAVNNAQMYDLDVSLTAGVVADNDVAITAIIEPAAIEVGLTNAEQIVITLANVGALTQSNIPYQVSIDNIIVANEVYAPSLAGGASVNVNVPTLVDLSDLGTYDICVATQLVGDEDTANDEVCKLVENTICIPTTTTTNGCNVDGIKQFVLGTIDVDDGGSGCNTDPGAPTGYADRTDLETDLDRRAGFNVHTLQASTLWNDERIKVWIDFNENNDFTDPGEEVLNQVFTLTGTLESFSITVPSGTSLGTKLLRARAFDATADPSTTGPCDDIVWGETQDYTVNIVDPSVTCTGVTKTWDGSIWSPTGAPGATDSVIIAGNFDTTTDGDIEACELAINTGITLTVAAGNFINVQNDITVEGTLTVEHQGSVVQVANDAIVTNNGTINVNVTTPVMGGRDFMVMGTPMSTETREDVFATAFRVRRHITAMFEPHPDVTADFGAAINFADDNTNTTVNGANHTGLLNPGEGYVIRPQVNGAADATYDYVHNAGTLNTGDVVFNLEMGFDGTQNGSPNVLANPYASAISASAFMTANGIDAIYLWEHHTQPNVSFPGQYTANFSMGDISMINNLGVGNPAANDVSMTAPTNVLASMQGFGLKAAAAGPATFTNAMRITDANNTLRTASDLERDIVRLNVTSINYERGSTTTVAFLEEATSNFDDGLDNTRMANIVSIYTHLEDGSKEFGIQSRELFTNNVKIPVGFQTLIEEETEYRITLADIQGVNLTEATAYLIDNYKGTITNLKETDYVFSSNQGRFDGRFTLQFKYEEILNTSEITSEDISLYPNPTDNILNIVSPKSPITGVTILDVQGREVSNATIHNQGQHQIDLSRLETAMYFVTITTQNGSITKRVIRK